MSTELFHEHLKKYISLDQAEGDLCLDLFKTRTVKKRSLLLKPGEPSRTENFITRGCFKIYDIDQEGVPHILMFGTEGWWVGDMYSFLTQSPATYFIEALEDSEILQITKPNLDLLYQKIPKFERLFRILLQNAFIAQQERIRQNLSFTAEQRYLSFVEKYPSLEQRIAQKEIAAYLGMTPEFLSSLRRKWANR